jgi:hypothetical protein
VSRSVIETHAFQRFLRASAPLLGAHTGVHERQLHVMQRRRAREQVERLEDEADLLVPNAGELVVRHLRYERPIEPVFARRRRIQTTDNVHQRRLAGAGRAHDRNVLVAANR